MKIMTPYQLDALTEIVNVGIGQAANILNEMVESHVTLQVPKIEVFKSNELFQNMSRFQGETLSAVLLNFAGPLAGSASLVFPPKSAAKLVSILTMEDKDTPELDSLKTATLNEVGNIVLNGVMGSIGNMLNNHMDFTLPRYMEDSMANILKHKIASDGAILFAKAIFTIKAHQIEGDILILFEVKSFDALLITLDSSKPES